MNSFSAYVSVLDKFLNSLCVGIRWCNTSSCDRALKVIIWSEQEFLFKIHSREITPKWHEGAQQFLYETHRLDSIYMSTKYNENLSKGINVME